MINAAPFMNGLKFLESPWINHIWEKLLEVFRERSVITGAAWLSILLP
jgi:hypothetical protein